MGLFRDLLVPWRSLVFILTPFVLLPLPLLVDSKVSTISIAFCGDYFLVHVRMGFGSHVIDRWVSTCILSFNPTEVWINNLWIMNIKCCWCINLVSLQQTVSGEHCSSHCPFWWIRRWELLWSLTFCEFRWALFFPLPLLVNIQMGAAPLYFFGEYQVSTVLPTAPFGEYSGENSSDHQLFGVNIRCALFFPLTFLVNTQMGAALIDFFGEYQVSIVLLTAPFCDYSGKSCFHWQFWWILRWELLSLTLLVNTQMRVTLTDFFGKYQVSTLLSIASFGEYSDENCSHWPFWWIHVHLGTCI